MSSHWKPATSRLETEQSAGVPVEQLGQSTRLQAAALQYDPQHNKPLVMPIYQSSTYKIDRVQEYLDILQQGGYIYQRFSNPNGQDAESRIKTVEGGYGSLVFNTGMSCMTTILMSLLKQGDHVVCQNPIYSGVHALLTKLFPKFGVEHTWVVSGSDVSQYEKAIRPNTKVIIGETPSNPLIDILDLQAFGALGQKHGVVTVVDSTYATPCLQQPIKHGVDISWHSGTKYMGGHSDSMAGVLTCRTQELYTELQLLRTHIGSNINPGEAALLTRGLRTMPCRMAVHSNNSQTIAEYLEKHPKVDKVFYPGLKSHPGHDVAKKQMSAYSGMITFEMKGGLEAARQFVEGVRLIKVAISLGGVESLIQHPATMTHGPMIMNDAERKEALITDGLIRFSVGIEDTADLLRDIEQALNKVNIPDEETSEA